MSAPVVLVEKLEGGVGLLTLNRPQEGNSWGKDSEQMFRNGLDQFGADPDVRVIVITGAGKTFCVGAYMGAPKVQGGGSTNEGAHDHRAVNHATTIPKPVIAAINGSVAGVGLAVALSCDFCFVSKEAKITTAFSKLGLIAEHGLSWILPHKVGLGRAMMMLMSSDVVSGEEAERIGLVEKCFDKESLLKETLAYARKLVANVPAATLAVIKNQLYRHPLLPFDDALQQSDRLMSATTKDKDYKEGVAAFVEKRPPKFGPLDWSSMTMVVAKSEFGLKSKL